MLAEDGREMPADLGQRPVADRPVALEQPLVSQQLAVLRNQGILTTQKEGLTVRYTVRDPLVGDLLDVARRIFNNQLTGTRGLLRELRREGIMKGMKRVKGMKR